MEDINRIKESQLRKSSPINGYNPDVIANIGEYNILKTQRRVNIRYMPFVIKVD